MARLGIRMGRSTNDLGSNDCERVFLDWWPSHTCSGSDRLGAFLLALIPPCRTISKDCVRGLWRGVAHVRLRSWQGGRHCQHGVGRILTEIPTVRIAFSRPLLVLVIDKDEEYMKGVGAFVTLKTSYFPTPYRIVERETLLIEIIQTVDISPQIKNHPSASAPRTIGRSIFGLGVGVVAAKDSDRSLSNFRIQRRCS